MSDHLTPTQIEGYGRRPLPAAEWLFLSDHLSACEPCRLKVEKTVDSEAASLALKSGVFDEAETRSLATGRVHLTFEQMAGLVDGTVPHEELQTVGDHLTWCEECETAVDDLNDFKDRVAAELELENRPSPTGVTSANRRPRLIAAITYFWPKSPRLVFGSALAALLLAAVGWLGWQKWQVPQVAKSKQDVAGASPSPGTSPPISPATSLEDASIHIARLNDAGGQVTLDREGKLSGVDHLPLAYQQMVRRALTDQELRKSPLLAGLTTPGSTPRGDGDARRAGFSLVEPIGTVLLSDHPTFRWSDLDGATGYVVEVYDERFSQAATSPQIIDHSWTAPQPLKRGGIYYWQVKAVKDGREFKAPSPPAPQAKFRILDAAQAGELAQARRAYGSSHLTLGLLYVQAGLLNEAEREFRTLQEANPNSALAHRLLRQVRTKS